MLRVVQIGGNLPMSFPVDPNAVFQPGMAAQLSVLGNNIVCGVSDGTSPIGIIDDVKTAAFTAPSIDEEVIVPAVGVEQNGQLVLPVDIKQELRNPNIQPNSFTSNINVALNPINGVITFPQGTPLNIDLDGDGLPDGVRAVVSYSYRVPNIPGEDTTIASGRVTVWFSRIIFQTDQYETNQRYAINSNLFISESGLFTTRQPTKNHPGIGIVTGPPSSVFGMLEAIWL